MWTATLRLNQSFDQFMKERSRAILYQSYDVQRDIASGKALFEHFWSLLSTLGHF